MNNGLYRQIIAADKTYWKFQDKLSEIYDTVDLDSPHVRRIS